MIIIVMIMIIIMIFIIIIVIITQPLVGSLFPVAIWLADFLSPSCPACAPLPRSLWRVGRALHANSEEGPRGELGANQRGG